MDHKLLLIILDGVPYRNFRRLFGNLEGWVDSGEARVWTQRAVLPSISASCYASIHTGVAPAEHGCTGNGNVFRLRHKDVFAQVREGGASPALSPIRSGPNFSIVTPSISCAISNMTSQQAIPLTTAVSTP